MIANVNDNGMFEIIITRRFDCDIAIRVRLLDRRIRKYYSDTMIETH